MRGNSCPQSLSVDGASKPIEIAKIFKNKFSSVTGGHISGSISKPYVNHTKSQEFFTEKELNIAVQKLNAGLGNDGIHSNHIKFLDSRCIKYILMVFNACTASSYIPEKMLRGEITPRPKDKFGNIQSSENYREVMNSTNFFKILEYCMLDRMSYCVELSSQQFGYRENTSTSLAICLLKEVMQKYCSEKSKVFACFLDLSKAFERVNHKILIDKMTSLNFPVQIVDLYRTIFENSHVRVKYQNALSEDWQAIRGVRQGGVTSAFLFSIYYLY